MPRPVRATSPTPPSRSFWSNNKEVVIAMIGLVSAVLVGVVSNWDKVFGHTVTASYAGYEPTGNIETEIRYFLEINGMRKNVSQMQDMMLQAELGQIAQGVQFKDPNAIKKFSDFIRSQLPSYDELINKIIPIWEKHFTLEQVQELNKFYSTPQMQKLVNQQPEIMTEAQPILASLMQDAMTKMSNPETAAQAQKILETTGDAATPSRPH